MALIILGVDVPYFSPTARARAARGSRIIINAAHPLLKTALFTAKGPGDIHRGHHLSEKLAYAGGIEPPFRDLESRVLPLNDAHEG